MARPNLEANWRKRMQRWRRSKATVSDFCRAEGVSKATFYSWRRRLGEEPGEPLQFFELAGAEGTAPIEIDVGGITVRLRSGFDAADLRAVVAVLSEER